MADKSTIEWTDATWNPTRGCTRVSEGCRNCYAEGVAARFSDPGMAYEGLAERTPSGPRWTGKIRLVEDHLELPLRWKRPRRIFVDSMSDLFHKDVPTDFILKVWMVMRQAHWHTFQILTKRPERMQYLVSEWLPAAEALARGGNLVPLPTPDNVWLGVSTEDQKTAEERIPYLIRTPAAVKFLSCEPLLGPVDLTPWLWETAGPEWAGSNPSPDLGWVITGAESGHGAREMDEAWVRSLRDQCSAAGVAFFYKQNALHGKKLPLPELDGRQWVQFPEDVRC